MENKKGLSTKTLDELTELVDNVVVETDHYDDKNSFVEDYPSLEFEDIYSFVCPTITPSFDEVPEKEGFSLFIALITFFFWGGGV